jgi:hypothetical protein
MQEFTAGAQADLLVCTSGGHDDMRIFRTITVPNDIPSISQLQGVHTPEYTPFYPDIIVGYLVSQRGGAEYEKLINSLGLGTQAMDAQSLIHLLAIGVIILRNITYQLSERREK